jgi:hypothetical protein
MAEDYHKKKDRMRREAQGDAPYERMEGGRVKYRGEIFPGLNKPKRAPSGSKHKGRVLAHKKGKVKVVNFGHRDYKHNYSAKAKANYRKRSAGIRDKSGKLTKDDKFSANYWARKELWPTGKKSGGNL